MNTPPSIRFGQTQASVLLDLLRALAALLVCLEHWRNLFYVDYGQIASHRILFALPYVVCGAGHQAVVIFFVLSGYLISGSIFRMMRHGEWSWRLYLTHRLVRLWIVLVPALLLGAALDFAGLHFHLAPALYAGQTGTHMMNRVPETFRACSFFGNLFFLQGILTTTFGSNTPLWSLANEFWYYILFPCAFLAFRKKNVQAVTCSECGHLFSVRMVCWPDDSAALSVMAAWHSACCDTGPKCWFENAHRSRAPVLSNFVFPCENECGQGRAFRLHPRSGDLWVSMVAACCSGRGSSQEMGEHRSGKRSFFLYPLSRSCANGGPTGGTCRCRCPVAAGHTSSAIRFPSSAPNDWICVFGGQHDRVPHG
ncbi:MAG: acyltransferase [Acidobacterium ailaaui]|nr:acyltransferase [Pseudacidobacterium ailaaui]MCL6464144.1 acyltransferase [Pseudacidobacterium ailaaui]